ncbi:MAG TPA: zf-HC2 domain-containing protein [Planctomycetota bacterium]|nr:zf-HC2 domain-containing protein [Planctomycetota bacterium]
MNTEDARIGAYVDGELDASERAEVEAWLESNPEMRDLARDLRSLDRVTRGAEPSPVEPREWRTMLENVLLRASAADAETIRAAREDGLPLDEREDSTIAPRASTTEKILVHPAARRRALVPLAVAAAAAMLVGGFVLFGPERLDRSGTTSTPPVAEVPAENPRERVAELEEERAADETPVEPANDAALHDAADF